MSKNFFDFYKDLAYKESSNRPMCENEIGFIGKYQMGVPAMIDLGYYKPNPGSNIYANNWNNGHFTGKDGIYSKQDFLNNEQVQDKIVRKYHNLLWSRLKQNGTDKYIGQIIKGNEITQSGLIASSHLMGAGAVSNYVRNSGNIQNNKDAFGTTIEEYMSRFKGYDVTPIAGYSSEQRRNTVRQILNSPETLKSDSIPMKRRNNSFSTGYAAPLGIFTPEQIGSMSPSEFTQNESAIMNQLEQGLIGNPEVALSNKYSGYTNPLTGNNRIYSAEDIGNLSGAEYSKYEPEINAQWGSIGIPSKNELHSASINGDTIYVSGYTRRDGTEVSGYYRSR